MDSPLLRPRLIVGLFIVTAGVFFGLDEMGLVDSSIFLRFWPALLMALGALRLLKGERGQVLGILLLVAGSWCLAINLGFLNADYFDIWPLFLVVVGGGLAYSAVRHADRDLVAAGDGSVISESAIFAGKKVVSASQQFRGGNLTGALGGCEVDLTQARIAGDEAVLDCVAFWGGLEITVPSSWRVVSDVIPILGGVDNSTEPPADDEAPQLRLTGYSVMGGVVVNNRQGQSSGGGATSAEEEEELKSGAYFHMEIGKGK